MDKNSIILVMVATLVWRILKKSMVRTAKRANWFYYRNQLYILKPVKKVATLYLSELSLNIKAKLNKLKQNRNTIIVNTLTQITMSIFSICHSQKLKGKTIMPLVKIAMSKPIMLQV